MAISVMVEIYIHQPGTNVKNIAWAMLSHDSVMAFAVAVGVQMLEQFNTSQKITKSQDVRASTKKHAQP
jgi:hypothetical protein